MKDVEFLKKFFEKLNQNNIHYCILRNAEEVERGDAHDVDMTVELSRMEDLFKIVRKLSQEEGWKLHMMTGTKKDPINIKCLNFFRIDNGKPTLIHIDIFPTCTWRGMVWIPNKMLLENIDESTIYHRADPAIEAVTNLLIRLLHNGYIKEKYMPNIYRVFTSNRKRVSEVMSYFLSDDITEYICDDVEKEAWDDIVSIRSKIIADMTAKLKKKPGYYGAKFNYYAYLGKKFLRKAAPMVAIEGTDGSGKTTIINQLPVVLERTFNENLIDYYHWRPGFIKSPNPQSNENTGTVCTEPHGKKPYNKLVSLGKFLYFNLDYILGYFFRVRIQLCKGRMVIFDRYYYDYYMDKTRYRLDISDRVLDLMKPLIPKPDVTILLVGDAETIYQRKREIPVEEIEKQNRRIQDCASKFNNPKLIDVCQDVEKVTDCVAVEILETNSLKQVSML